MRGIASLELLRVCAAAEILTQREIFRPLGTRQNRFTQLRHGVVDPENAPINGVNLSAAQTSCPSPGSKTIRALLT